MEIISKNISNHHSYDIIQQFEEAILQDLLISNSIKRITLLDKIHHAINSKLKKIGFQYNFETCRNLKKQSLFDKKHRFAILMGPNGSKWNNFFPTWHSKSVYMFDAWPSLYPKIFSFIKTYKIDHLFVSSSKSAKELIEVYGLKNVFWVPEGIKLNYYNYLPYEEKIIDLISYGRSYKTYHDAIFGKIDMEYIFPKSDELLFKTHKDLSIALSKSKISICFPSSLTHPERTSGTETMTNRYLEAIASKCLIIGKAPLEMVELFGYNPIIEVDFENPCDQLNMIIQNYQNYFGLIEKNYQILKSQHLWENRWCSIKEYLAL